MFQNANYIGLTASSLGVFYTIAIFFNLNFLNKYNSKKVISVMVGFFLLIAFTQLGLALSGKLNIYTLFIPMVFNIIAWGIIFPHISTAGLMLYSDNPGTCASNMGFTFYVVTALGTFLFDKMFSNNFYGISFFTFIIAIIAVVLAVYFDLTSRREN